MNEFISWSMLGDFATLTSIVLTATQFTKNIKFINKIATKYWSYILAFILITLTNIQTQEFAVLNLVLYALSAMFVSTSANGIYNVGDKIDAKITEKKLQTQNNTKQEDRKETE